MRRAGIFLDSDDLLYPYALEFGTRLLERFPDVSMVCAEVTGFDDHGFLDRYHLKRYHGSTYRDEAITYDAIFPSSIPLPDTGAVPDAVLREDPGVRDRRAYYGNIYDAYLLNIVLFQNSAILRRGVVEEIGPRNEQIYCFEELDYLVRLSRHHDVLFADVPTYMLRYHDADDGCHYQSCDSKQVSPRRAAIPGPVPAPWPSAVGALCGQLCSRSRPELGSRDHRGCPDRGGRGCVRSRGHRSPQAPRHEAAAEANAGILTRATARDATRNSDQPS